MVAYHLDETSSRHDRFSFDDMIRKLWMSVDVHFQLRIVERPVAML